MNTTHTSIINSIFTNGHHLTIFELDFYDTANHPRYIFQDAVYMHGAVLGPDSVLEYYPVYEPIHTSRAYDKYEDALHEYQAFYDMYQKTPDANTNIQDKAGFGTAVSRMYFGEIAKEVIEVNDDNIKFDEPTSDTPAYVEFNFCICGHRYTICAYIIIDASKLSGTIVSNVIDINDSSKHITGHGKFYIDYDAECGCSIGSNNSIYTGKDPDMDDGKNTLDFMNEQGIPTDTVFRFIHYKALDVFTKYFISKENKKNG